MKNIKIFLVSFLFFLAIMFLVKDRIFDNFIYKNYIQSSAKEFQIDPILIFSVIMEESKFHNKAVSNVGAIGLMQLMPKTSKEIALELGVRNFKVEMLNIPEINIRFGSYYLKKLIVRYDRNLVLALSAYNAGIGIVDGWIIEKNEKGIKNFGLKDIRYKSTRIFVKKVIRNYEFLKKLNEVVKVF